MRALHIFKSRSRLRTVLGMLLLGLTIAARAQVPISATIGKQNVLLEVSQQAARDAKRGGAMLSPHDLDLLFGRELAEHDISMHTAWLVYQDTFRREREREKPWWQSDGWIAFAVLFVLFVFKEYVVKAGAASLGKAFEMLYQRVAGWSVVRPFALSRYRKRVREKCARIKLPFWPEHPLDTRDVYIPLKLSAAGGATDALAAVVDHRKLAIVGPPGSGKSMILKRWTLDLVDDRETLPLLLNLNELNEDERPIQVVLVDLMRRHGFPHAESFLAARLRAGTITLLCDGLDEVNTLRRQAVVTGLRQFIQEFSTCRYIVTCRNASYRDEFFDEVDTTLEVAEFEDAQIHSFLRTWSAKFPPTKSVEQLISTLQERPHILAIARRPLLLTILAFLYVRETFVLPQSRSEFFEMATAILLSQWKTEVNKHSSAQKMNALKALALANQDAASEQTSDRRTVEAEIALQIVRGALSRLDQDTRLAASLLDEIVERSGLLLAIDGGSRFYFPHLTWQEFFAAAELRDNATGLLQRYDQDNDTWREVVSLWCGLDHDSSAVLRRVFQLDKLAALEFLAEAQVVSSADDADEILNFWLEEANAGVHQPRLTRALAAVATGASNRAHRMRVHLASLLQTDERSEPFFLAVNALSHTNSPAAVLMLGEHYDEASIVNEALVRMGDVAVPWLADRAFEGSVRAARSLGAIDTVNAAKELLTMIWYAPEPVARAAALHLAMTLIRPEIEALCATSLVPEEWRTLPGIDWIWRPFDEGGASMLTPVAGRVGWLLLRGPKGRSSERIDPRLAVPLIIHEIGNADFDLARIGRKASRELARVVDSISKALPIPAPTTHMLPAKKRASAGVVLFHVFRALKSPDTTLGDVAPLREQFVREVVKEACSQRVQWLFESLDSATAFALLECYCEGPRPTPGDWCNILRPIRYQFDSGFHFKSVVGVIAGISVLALYQALVQLKTSETASVAATVVMLSTSVVVASFIGGSRPWPREFCSAFPLSERVVSAAIAPVIAIYVLAGIVKRLTAKPDERMADAHVGSLLGLMLIVPYAPMVAIYASLYWLRLGLIHAITFWMGAGGAVLVLVWIGRRKDRAARNRLHALELCRTMSAPRPRSFWAMLRPVTMPQRALGPS